MATKYTKWQQKYNKWPQNRPNGRKIYQHFSLQDPPKFTPNWEFWFENMPSGNPALFRHI
jgi:hypothetical protein